MIALPREMLRGVHALLDPVYSTYPLQLGMHGDPWRVAVASMLLCRTRRVQAEGVLRNLLSLWPTAPELARAKSDLLMESVRPCGLHRSRARQLTRFSVQWLEDSWSDARDLVGVGVYVADCIGLFCFGCTDIESGDHALREYIGRMQPCTST